MLTPSELTLDKGTLYVHGPFGFTKVEAKDIRVDVKPYAQYSHAVHVTYIPKGKQKARGHVDTYKPTLIVLSGWGHFDPPSAFKKNSDGSEQSKDSCFSDVFLTDFDEALKASGALANGLVAADFRGFDPMMGGVEPPEPTTFVFRVVTETGISEYADVEALKALHPQVGVLESRSVRESLRGQPIFGDLCGPMYDGKEGEKAVIRYETAKINAILSA
jgi:hypothetical protein